MKPAGWLLAICIVCALGATASAAPVIVTDIDASGQVDETDLSIVRDNCTVSADDDSYNAAMDVNRDGSVDFGDLVAVRNSLGAVAGDENEPNDRFYTSTSIPADCIVQGAVSPAGDEDYFILDVTQSGVLYVGLKDVPDGIIARVTVYNGARDQIAEASSTHPGMDIEQFVDIPTDDFYYIRVTYDGEGAESISLYSLCVFASPITVIDQTCLPNPF